MAEPTQGKAVDVISPPMNSRSNVSYNLEFNDLRMTVPSKRGSKPHTVILKGVSGYCRSSRLTAIMGASGAGKTTLLNALACKVPGKGKVTGEVLLNGKSFTARDFKHWGVYVMQAEPLLATATVKETIMTSALLRLPLSISHKEKVQRVDDIINQLGLQHCQGTMVGDEGTGMGVRGISGGERKRVTVGVGLVTQPRVLLLDEPTSGLDSETAVSIIELMQQLAQQGRTVVTTIHQPNSSITRCFDDLLLLAHGNIIYMGKWAKSVEYFQAVGYQCPMYTNPSDYFMSLMKDEEASPKLVELWKKADSEWITTPRLTAPEQATPFTEDLKAASKVAATNGHHPGEDFYDAEDVNGVEKAAAADIEMGSVKINGNHERTNGTTSTSADKEDADEVAAGRKQGLLSRLPAWETKPWKNFGKRKGGDKAETAVPSSMRRREKRQKRAVKPPPAWYQIWVLAIRNVKFYLRNPELMLAKLFTYIFMGGFMGLMYLRLPLDTTTAGYNRSAALWISMFAFTLMPSETACSVWNQERAVITKEIKSGQYRLASYFLSKTLVSVPFETVIAIIFTIIIYFMIGFQAKLYKFLIFMVTLVLVNLVSEMVGFICGVITKEVTIGLILISVVIYFCFAFSGFIVQPIPKYFVWLHKISYFTLAYTVLVNNEFTGLDLRTPFDPICSAELNFIPPPPANSYNIAQNIGFLVLITVGIRVIAYLVLWASFASWALPQALRKPVDRVKSALGFCCC